jgi:hypothetical protein
MKWLLHLYPRAWRQRYGAEVAQINDELIYVAALLVVLGRPGCSGR